MIKNTLHILVEGAMLIRNSTLAFFNNICDRHDTAIQVSQSNDDGQFPITTSSISKYKISADNIIFNGLPNLSVINPSNCGVSAQTRTFNRFEYVIAMDMDYDGPKKNLLTDLDGTLFDKRGRALSPAERFWGKLFLPTRGHVSVFFQRIHVMV